MTDDRLPGCFTLAIAVLIVFIVTTFASGCGPTTPVQTSAAIEAPAIAMASVAASTIEAAVTADLDEHCTTTADPGACADEREATTWAPVRAVFRLVRLALADWIIALRIATTTHTDPIATTVSIVRRLIAEYESLSIALKLLGVALPDLPNEIKSLLPPLSSGGST